MKSLNYLSLSSVLALIAVGGQAGAQTTKADDDASVEKVPPASITLPPSSSDIIVTGYRRSLQDSIQSKKNDIGFSDSIFAEDIGKFPDTNIAESIARIPGVTISRDIDGAGINVAIRGLGTNFTRVLLNNAPLSVASNGGIDQNSTNREVDLDLLPTELFTQLTVNKSPQASMIEGGAAGIVNMRQARPFDYKGNVLSASAELVKGANADRWGKRGSLLASARFGNFGVIGGVAVADLVINNRGFETVAWTNPNLSATQNINANRNSTGGGGWTIPAVVPANAGAGLVAGTPINQAFLLANNPGRTIEQIDNAIIPRLGREMRQYGSRQRISAILGMEWRPSDALRFYLDGIYARKKNENYRTDMNWAVRSTGAIPINMEVDRSDCSLGCVVTKGTYANASYFYEFRTYEEDVDFINVNPGMSWEVTGKLKIDLAANWNRSKFSRITPTVALTTPTNSGLVVDFVNNGDGVPPTITPNIDLQDGNNFGWNSLSRVQVSLLDRETNAKGAHFDAT